jgi:FKBP-type peptidyl-prolyl cis-trans isomerase FkpA
MRIQFSTLTLLSLGVLVTACQPKAEEAKSATPAMTDDQKAIYAYGASLGEQVARQNKQLRLSPEELTAFQNGLNDTLTGKPPQVEPDAFQDKFQALADARFKAAMAEDAQKGVAYAESAAKEPGATKTASGLVFRTVSAGNGASPKASDVVKVHYEGKLVDGTVFDSSRARGEPAEFGLDRVIGCWTEGVQRMKVGEKAVLVCPPAIAYGERGAGNSIPPNATLIFDVELLAIAAPPPPAKGKN